MICDLGFLIKMYGEGFVVYCILGNGTDNGNKDILNSFKHYKHEVFYGRWFPMGRHQSSNDSRRFEMANIPRTLEKKASCHSNFPINFPNAFTS